MELTIRVAKSSDILDVIRILDASLLECDRLRITGIIDKEFDRSAVYVAEREGQILGTLVLDRGTISALAVRRHHRHCGIGQSLVKTCLAAYDTVEATFDSGLCPFYRSLGFTITSRCSDRYRAIHHSGSSDSLDQ